MTDICDLNTKHCKPCEDGTLPLTESQSRELLQLLNEWELNNNCICKNFEFKNYYQVLALVNAVAWMTHREDHHPDMNVSYNKCRVEYSTHAIGGLSENDFICAAKVDALFKQ